MLCGDPKQLGAVTKSRCAFDMGFRKSLMEYLMERRLYKRDRISDRYNEKYITQLVENFRSHHTILEIPNTLFYLGKLRAKASKGLSKSHTFIVVQVLRVFFYFDP